MLESGVFIAAAPCIATAESVLLSAGAHIGKGRTGHSNDPTSIGQKSKHKFQVNSGREEENVS